MLIKKFNKESFEKDKASAKLLLRYLLFYGTFIVVLSLFSYLFDLVFYSIYYSSAKYPFHYGMIDYIPFYMIYGFLFFPTLLMYNYLVKNVLQTDLWVRIIAGFCVSVFLCFIIKSDLEYGYYIGKLREIKNLLAFSFTSMAIELLRYYISKKKKKA